MNRSSSRLVSFLAEDVMALKTKTGVFERCSRTQTLNWREAYQSRSTSTSRQRRRKQPSKRSTRRLPTSSSSLFSRSSIKDVLRSSRMRILCHLRFRRKHLAWIATEGYTSRTRGVATTAICRLVCTLRQLNLARWNLYPTR